MPRLRSFGLLFATLTLGCSLVNAPDEVNPGSGGSGAAGAAGGGGAGAGGGTGATGGTGGATPCTMPEECAALTTDCATGECADGSCVATPQPAGMLCGTAPSGSCDLQDACDDSGSCVPSFVPDGTFCTDCAAGAGNCETCQQGVCGDCTTRALTKSFNHPLSASGWTLTGDWAIFPAAPPSVHKVFKGACNDGADNDGDSLIDMADPGCDHPNDFSENLPSQCNNGADDDGDTLTDLNDPDCNGIGDDTEIQSDAIPFEHPVLGSDGNRVRPYGFQLSNGSGELENSTATSPPTVLPSELQFRSWHLDEGLSYDLKAVAVSTNSQNFTTIAICEADAEAFPFCNLFTHPSLGGPFPTSRSPEDWDDVTLSVPPEMVGEVGYVRFTYNTKDSSWDWERGWYIDALNFAQDCACAGNGDCAFLDGDCSTGQCNTTTNECELAAENIGTACENTADDGCALKECNQSGWCESDGIIEDGLPCTSCEDGVCSHCVASQCQSCPEIQSVDFLDTSKFVFTGDWTVDFCLSPNSVTPNQGDCFPGAVAFGDPQTAPLLGSNGSKSGANPYTSASRQISLSTMVTAPTVIPATLEFKSWHQDRGGNDTFNLRDKKTVRVSVDGGNSWTTIVNCDGNTTTPFCIPSTPNTNRALDQWDTVSIPMDVDLVGEIGIFEFTYDTVDLGAGWERGWYVDDLNINRCECYQECPLIAPPPP